ncbi:ABC transporter permease [Ilumatobacter nonamiensis]|uniref:ABC transporter permease n=1 Tax=Ilumatobacter nonamiensis TaxID=467093 RepID=UPI00034DEF97|nr:ABC transporter permease [Ilumatobacter nonamiensis]
MIREVARREIVTRGRSKVYRVTTFLLLALTVVGVIGAAVFGSGGDDAPTEYDVAAPTELGPALDASAPDDVRIDIQTPGDGSPTAIRTAVENGDVDVAVIDGPTLLWNDEPDPLLQAVVVGALDRASVEQRADELGVDSSTLAELFAPAPVDEEFVDPPSDSESARTAVALLGIFIMFFAIQVYGSQIAMVVVEEKANRIVEILLALVSPRDLLAGKVLGVGALASVQVAIPLVGLAGALAVSDFADAPASAYASLPLLALVFVLGFTLYGVLFAFVGSLVSRQEDAQQALLPVFLPIFLGYLLSLQALSSPDSTVATIASVVPFTSPFVLPVTVAQEASSPLIVAAALVLLVATTIGALAFAARVYEFTLLRTGSRISLREAVRLARD